MTIPTSAERELYSDLTRLFMAMRHAPFADLEQKIEERFREFARLNPDQNAGGLQITFTLKLPDGADDWALYGTEYQTLPVEQPSTPRLAVAGGPAEIVAFPSDSAARPVAATDCAGQIISFPFR